MFILKRSNFLNDNFNSSLNDSSPTHIPSLFSLSSKEIGIFKIAGEAYSQLFCPRGLLAFNRLHLNYSSLEDGRGSSPLAFKHKRNTARIFSTTRESWRDTSSFLPLRILSRVKYLNVAIGKMRWEY